MSKLTFLFWNTNKKDILEILGALVSEEKPDLIILSELKPEPATILLNLNRSFSTNYEYVRSHCNSIHIFSAFGSEHFQQIVDASRYSIKELNLPGRRKALLVMAHLPSKRSYSDESQGHLLLGLVRVIRESESKVGHTNTIMVGDLNINPFEKSMIGRESLHALSSRQVVMKKKDRRPVFYNPMWGLLGDRDSRPGGSHYYDNNDPISYCWHLFDQVLIRPALIDTFDEKDLAFIYRAGKHELISPKGRPQPSDHLPLRFKLHL